jgi:hypothetical protein
MNSSAASGRSRYTPVAGVNSKRSKRGWQGRSSASNNLAPRMALDDNRGSTDETCQWKFLVLIRGQRRPRAPGSIPPQRREHSRIEITSGHAVGSATILEVGDSDLLLQVELNCAP